MAVQASFDGETWKSIQGYRIVSQLQPGDGGGFGSNFYVYFYVELGHTPKSKVEKQWTPYAYPSQVEGVTGNLRIWRNEDPKFEYEFDEIELTSIQVGMSRRTRFQLFEFRLDLEGDTDSNPVSLEHHDRSKPEPLGQLQKCTLHVGNGDDEELLYFKAFLTPSARRAWRFGSIRNKQQSWLDAMIDWDYKIRQGNDGGITFNFGQFDGQVSLDSTNLAYLLLEESWGVLQEWPLYSTRALVERDLSEADLEPLRMREMTMYDMLNHHHMTGHKARSYGKAVETATVVFQDGYQDVRIT